jgi:hypothetical protein
MGFGFEMFDVNGVCWQTPRISWDGLRKFELLDAGIRGEAYDPPSDGWVQFELNLHTGDVVGGSYCEA